MAPTILITDATDGLGLETARALAGLGHTLLVHGRNATKLDSTKTALLKVPGAGKVETYKADLSNLYEVKAMATTIRKHHSTLDVLINNAGVYKLGNPITEYGWDARFVVNTLAPYLLTKLLFPVMTRKSRVINLSSAAQSAVDLDAVAGKVALNDSQAYAQSKLAILMWSFALATRMNSDGPKFIALNPGSFLGTKMVRDAYGTKGKDIGIGVDILTRAAFSDAFSNASGTYFDNDSGQFAQPHPDALDARKNQQLVDALEHMIQQTG